MIVLAVQLQIFVLSLLSGWAYGLCYSCFTHLYLGKKVRVLRVLSELVFQVCFHSCVYYLLFLLNGGVLRLYYVFLFLIGLFLYYIWYYPLLLPVFNGVVYYVKIPIKLFFLVFSKFISIIKMLIKKVKRRLIHNNDDRTKKESS